VSDGNSGRVMEAAVAAWLRLNSILYDVTYARAFIS